MRVLVVSDHALIGQSLVISLRNLSEDGEIEAEYCEPDALMDCVRQGRDVILIDATSDFARSLSIVRLIIQCFPEARVVVLGADADEASTYESILEGAYGYVTVGTPVDALAGTLRGVARGELGLSRATAQRVILQLRQATHKRRDTPPPDIEGKLTPREQEVFDLVRRGLRSRAIAEQLSIAEATVYKHIQNILDKLRVHSRAQAIILSSVNEEVGLAADQN